MLGHGLIIRAAHRLRRFRRFRGRVAGPHPGEQGREAKRREQNPAGAPSGRGSPIVRREARILETAQIAHVHVYVNDRPKAVEWLDTVWDATPDAEDHEMSMFTFGSTQLIINDVEEGVESTIAFASDDCDRDYEDVIARGAVSVREPQDKPWGVRIAFLQGPGNLTFEIEERLQESLP